MLRLEHLLADVTAQVSDKMADRDMDDETRADVAAKVALAAIKYGDLSNQASKDYVFDLDRFTSFEGNTGPYIMYTIVRIKSLLAKVAQNAIEVDEQVSILPHPIRVQQMLCCLCQNGVRSCRQLMRSRHRTRFASLFMSYLMLTTSFIMRTRSLQMKMQH